MRLDLDLWFQLRAEDWTRRRDVHLNLRDSLLVVHDPRESKRHASALNQRFVSEHPARIDLPRFAVPVALREVLGDLHWMRPLFVADRSGYAEWLSVFVFSRKRDAIKLRMGVHHLDPTINADHRLDTAVASGKCVDFAGKRIESVLVGDDYEGEKLFVGRFGHQSRFERLQQTGWLNVEFARHHCERGLFCLRY